MFESSFVFRGKCCINKCCGIPGSIETFKLADLLEGNRRFDKESRKYISFLDENLEKSNFGLQISNERLSLVFKKVANMID